MQKSSKKPGAMSSTKNSTTNFPSNTSLCFPQCGNYQRILQPLPLEVRERPTTLPLLCATHLSPIQVTCQCCNPVCGIFPGKSDEQVRRWSNQSPTEIRLCQTAAPPTLPITIQGHFQVNHHCTSSVNLGYNTPSVGASFLAFFHIYCYTAKPFDLDMLSISDHISKFTSQQQEFFFVLKASAGCCLSVFNSFQFRGYVAKPNLLPQEKYTQTPKSHFHPFRPRQYSLHQGVAEARYTSGITKQRRYANMPTGFHRWSAMLRSGLHCRFAGAGRE